MTKSLRSELEPLSAAKLVEALSIHIYEPPLSTARDQLREVAEPLRVPILVLDFDTELCMNGMLGFLENSTGLYLSETIEAFDKIGATETAAVLRAIEKTLERHGVTPSGLREDFESTQQYEITSFQQLHGDLGTMTDEIEEDARRLYLYGESDLAEPIWSLLEAFVERHRTACLAEIARITGE
jgi:hypothetical protein